MVNDGQFDSPPESRLSELFSDSDYRFHMRLRRGRVADFFAPSPRADEVLAERCAWLERNASAYTAFLPEADSAILETHRMLTGMGVLAGEVMATESSEPCERMLNMGRCLEPDVLWLQRRGDSNDFHLVAGCVCFPSSWSLAEKIVKPLDVIHRPVPQLNQKLAAPIGQFLRRMEPGIAWCRENWGLSRSPELNHHPDRGLPRLDALVKLDEVWLRVERQALVALPQSGSVLFGIRIEVYALGEVSNEPAARDGLRRALVTMPSDVAEYKGLGLARSRIIGLLSNLES